MKNTSTLRMHILPASSYDGRRGPHILAVRAKLRSSYAIEKCPHHLFGFTLILFSKTLNVYYSLRSYSNLFGFCFCFLTDNKEHYFKSAKVLFYIKTSL